MSCLQHVINETSYPGTEYIGIGRAQIRSRTPSKSISGSEGTATTRSMGVEEVINVEERVGREVNRCAE